MDTARNRTAAWVAAEVLPHEAEVRNWLARHWRTTIDIDDVIQEAYCRISGLESVDHIRSGRAYLFTTARSIAIDISRSHGFRHSVPMTESEWSYVMDEGPTPDRAADASQKLEQALELLSQLSWTCRQVIELRRVHGLSQAETARQLGVSESVVENHIVRGIRRVLAGIAAQDMDEQNTGERLCRTPTQIARQRKRRRGGPFA